MTADRLKQIEEIHRAALAIAPEKRSAFLTESCGTDIELQQEVIKLLAFGHSSFGIEDAKSQAITNDSTRTPDLQSIIGKTMKQYEVRSLLGKGGMGSVYLAWDTILERKVAIKLLSDEFSTDSSNLSRFFQEARSASALNHPNILTIHEIGEFDGTNYIVTEFIEGRTLKRYAREEQPSLNATLEIASQVLSALSAAHEAGIIHRDIKPENVMIRKDGFAKVLDFGLAKSSGNASAELSDPDAATRMKEMTAPGLIMGTPQYMSPEQARGQKVDSRTDIFSFGILLYEMLAGVPPFTGVNQLDTIGSILKDEPKPLIQHLPDIPGELDHLVSKSLRKDREQRYQSIKDVFIDLTDIKNTSKADIRLGSQTQHLLAPTTMQTTTSIATERRFSLIHVLALLLLSGVLAGAVWWYIPADQNSSFLKSSEVVSWASTAGEVYSAGSFSPDGKMVAFASTKTGTKNIWIKQTTSGEAIQITKDAFRNDQPIWSPNGEELAYYSTKGGKPGFWRIPILGGSPKLISTIESGSSSLRMWSKKDLIYFESKNDLFAIDVNLGQIKKVTDFPNQSVNSESISISMDEKRVAYVTLDGDLRSMWTKKLNDEAPRKLLTTPSEIKNTAWHPDNQRIVYSTVVDGTFQIFVTDINATPPTQISSAERDSFVLDVASDGTKILYGSAKEESDIWGVGLKDGKEFIVASGLDSELWPNVSPDGKSIAYQSINNLSQGNNLFSGKLLTKTLNSDEQPSEITSNGILPVWSPDGQKIAYIRVVGGIHRIETIKATGDGQKQSVADGIRPISFSVLPYNRIQTNDFSWSPDSGKIAYISSRSGQNNIWLVNADGSNDTQLTDNQDSKLYLYCPIWSADGKRIAFSTKTVNTSTEGKPTFGVRVIDTETKVSKPVTQHTTFLRLIGWGQSGHELFVGSTEGSETNSLPTDVSLMQINIETGKIRQLAMLTDTYFSNIQLSPDRKNVAFAAHHEGKDNIRVLSMTGGEEKTLTDNNDLRLYVSSLAWSPDNNSIFFGKQLRYSLLSMLTNFK